jgi:hypothetical protein
MWNVNVHYRRTLNANKENKHMQGVHVWIHEPITLGLTPLVYFMELHVSSNLDVVCCN